MTLIICLFCIVLGDPLVNSSEPGDLYWLSDSAFNSTLSLVSRLWDAHSAFKIMVQSPFPPN